MKIILGCSFWRTLRVIRLIIIPSIGHKLRSYSMRFEWWGVRATMQRIILAIPTLPRILGLAQSAGDQTRR